MMSDNRELEELVQRFYDPQQAREVLEELRRAEKLFAKEQSPEPSAKLVRNIKDQVHQRLSARQARRVRRRFIEVVAAVIMVVVTLMGVLSYQGKHAQNAAYASVMGAGMWETNDVSSEDARLATLEAEIEQLEQESFGDTSEAEMAAETAVRDLEIQLVQANGEFWKD